MEALLENVSWAAELLAVAAHTGAVTRWDRPTLSRAFGWARYCEQVYSSFHGNATIRRVLEEQLQLTSQRLRAVIAEYAGVSFSDLRRCQQLLLSGLLSNPELPASIIRTLFQTRHPVGVVDGEYEDAAGLCSFLVQCRSACKVLQPPSSAAAIGADAEVQGEMLMERLGALLSQGRDLHQAGHLLHSVLQVFDGAVQHFCLVMATALLMTGRSADQTAAQDFLLDWLQDQPGLQDQHLQDQHGLQDQHSLQDRPGLQDQHSLLQRMCSELPSGPMKDLAKQHQKCRDVFCSGLTTWASEMKYSTRGGGWVHPSTNPTLSFQNLLGRFRALSEACPSLRRKVDGELNALKISDGGFDVEGLSVWGDIVSALNQ